MNIVSIVDSTGGFYPQDFVPDVLSPELVATAAWLSDEYPLMAYDLAIDVTSNDSWTCWFRRDPVDLSLGRTPPKFSLQARDEWNLTSRFLPGIDSMGEWVSALPMSGGNWLAFHHPDAGEDTDTVLRRWVQIFYPASWDAIQPPPPAQSVAMLPRILLLWMVPVDTKSAMSMPPPWAAVLPTMSLSAM